MKLGVDIGGTKCAVVLGDTEGIIKKIRFATTTYEETMENIRNAIREMDGYDAIGISCGGPLDSKKGLILSPPNLVGWDNVPITSMLSEEFGVPVCLCNDADACALAEWKFGAGKGTENMIFLTFGTGMGAGLILNGKLYSGTNGMAGEVGHTRMSENGPVGYGKAGSFEGFCSGGGIAQIGKTLALEQLQMGKTLPYCKTPKDLENITAKLLAEYAYEGDALAKEAYRISGEMLGRGLAFLIDVFNPEKIVIGSVFARAQNLLWDSARAVIEAEALPLSTNVCSVLPAQLGEQIGDYAAIATALLEE